MRLAPTLCSHLPNTLHVSHLSSSLFLPQQIGADGLEGIARACTRLETLELQECPRVGSGASDGDAGRAAVQALCKLPALRQLNVARCPVTDSDVDLLGREAGELRKLNLFSCALVTQTALASLACAQLPLQHLNVTNCAGLEKLTLGAAQQAAQGLVMKHPSLSLVGLEPRQRAAPSSLFSSRRVAIH